MHRLLELWSSRLTPSFLQLTLLQLTLCAALLVTMGAAASAEEAGTRSGATRVAEVPDGVRELSTDTLDNGLRVTLANPVHPPLITEALLVVRAGSDFDQSTAGDLAWVTAEALVSGLMPRHTDPAAQESEHGADAEAPERLRRFLARTGIELDLTVGREMAVFRFAMPPRHAVAFVHFLADLLTRDEISATSWEEAVLRRRAALAQESNDVWRLANLELREMTWDGLPSEVAPQPSKTSAERSTTFFRRHFTAPRMAFSLWGEFPIEMLRDTVRRRLSAVRSEGDPPATETPNRPSPKPVAGNREIACLEAPGADPPALFLAVSTLADKDTVFYGWQMLAQTLGASHVSRLYQRLRFEENLSYTVEASCSAVGDEGLALQVIGQTDDVVRAQRIVLEELERLRREPLTPDELARAKAMLRSRVLLDHESLRDVFYRRALGDLSTRKIRSPEAASAVVEAMTAETLREIAESTLDPSRAVSLVVGDAAKSPCRPRTAPRPTPAGGGP